MFVLGSPSSSSTPVIITSTTEQVKSDLDDSNSLPSSCDSKNLGDKNCSSNDEKASCNSQSPQSKPKSLFSDPIITSSCNKKNGVKDSSEKSLLERPSFLRPSILSSGFSSFSTSNSESGKSSLPFSLNCPKLNLDASKFGDGSFANAFTSSVSSGTSESSSSNPLDTKKNNTDNAERKSPKPTLGIFSTKFNANSSTQASASPKTSVISVPNFVFGQNLHERVTDSVKVANVSYKSSTPEIKTNGTSEMLFTSVVASKEVKENFRNDSFDNSKQSTLLEDAARCQEARANKRKYEEVLVTTGEEDEENILQVSFRIENFSYVKTCLFNWCTNYQFKLLSSNMLLF